VLVVEAVASMTLVGLGVRRFLQSCGSRSKRSQMLQGASIGPDSLTYGRKEAASNSLRSQLKSSSSPRLTSATSFVLKEPRHAYTDVRARYPRVAETWREDACAAAHAALSMQVETVLVDSNASKHSPLIGPP
jgi:hypothetical protein